MNFITQIANSRAVQKYCRWPSSRALRIYWAVMGVLTLLMCADFMRSGYNHAAASGLHGSPLAGHLIVDFLLGAFVGGYLSLMLLLVCGLYYRMGTEIASGYRNFRAGLPGAIQGLLGAAAAVVIFVRGIPAFFAGCWRGICRMCSAIAGIPAAWRAMSSKQKKSAVVFAGLMVAFFGTIVAFFPVAQKLSAMLPSWAPMADAPWLQALCIDMFLGSLLGAIAMTLLFALITGITLLFKR